MRRGGRVIPRRRGAGDLALFSPSSVRLLSHWASLSAAMRAIERCVSTDRSSLRADTGLAATFDFASSHIGFESSLLIRKMCHSPLSFLP